MSQNNVSDRKDTETAKTKYYISNEKTLFDIFNMINPNCYQALVMKSIMDYNKEAILFFCDKLMEAAEYYKWDISYKKNDYIDSLICVSNLEPWQKKAMLHIIANDISNCKKEVESSMFAKAKAAYAYKDSKEDSAYIDFFLNLNDVFSINNFGV